MNENFLWALRKEQLCERLIGDYITVSARELLKIFISRCARLSKHVDKYFCAVFYSARGAPRAQRLVDNV
ncbi:MAG: hypothetical protein BroJett039_03310 [Chloroflexota bacterium]|nr:MAG: hypothetical protein BroJett039_03310 [Chloroflexota bacterium]